MAKILYYVAGVVFFGWLVATLTGLVLEFLPFVAMVMLVALPLYGILRSKMNWQDEKYGIKRFAKGFAGFFKFGKRSWTFYLILGVAIGFIYEDLIWKMVETLSFSLVALFVFYALWEMTRVTLEKLPTKIQIMPFREALKQGWQ